jgi:ceramide synthetase
MVFLCHDVNDIFLEAAKLARYARLKSAPTALFIAFALSWFVSRLFYFPKWIIASVWVDPVELVAKPNGIDAQPHWGFLVGLLCFLLVLHAYWSVLILKVIARNLREGQPDDVRESDSEDDGGGEGEEGGGKGKGGARAAGKKRA